MRQFLKKLIGSIVVLGLVTYVVVATGLHKSVYSFVAGHYAKDVHPTYSPVVR